MCYLIQLFQASPAPFYRGTAASAMLFVNQRTKLKEDVIIGLAFSSFFAFELFMLSLQPAVMNILSNLLVIAPSDIIGANRLYLAGHFVGKVEKFDGGIL